MLELLPPGECWRLLATTRVGRVGLVVDGEPVILPVNYAVHDRTMVLRTAGGTKLATMTSWPSVAFEVDGSEGEESGWSVLVSGWSERITDTATLREVEALGLEVWAPGPKLHWVRIVPRRVSGRRIPPRDRVGQIRSSTSDQVGRPGRDPVTPGPGAGVR